MQARIRVCGILTILVAFVLLAPVAAETPPSLVGVRAANVILLRSPEDESFHVLLSFPDLDALSGRTVVSARLLVPSIEVETALHLQARAVARDWVPETVSWTEPWTTDGGDIREGPLGRCLLVPGADRSYPFGFDVSEAVRDIVETGEGNFGFLVLLERSGRDDGSDLVGLPSGLGPAFSSMEGIKLMVLCGSEP